MISPEEGWVCQSERNKTNLQGQLFITVMEYDLTKVEVIQRLISEVFLFWNSLKLNPICSLTPLMSNCLAAYYAII